MGNKTLEEEDKKIDLKSDPERLIINLIAETSRGSAIVGITYLEDLLSRYLKARLVDYNEGFKIIDHLNFERKTILCYMFGMIDNETKSDLIILNKIRNKFAHNKDANNFNSTIDKLNIPSTLDNLNIIKYLKDNKRSISPRIKYESVVNFYFGFLTEKIKDCKRIKSPKCFYK